mmetsp:Transcript_30221/g.91468  ORF Transcript_30221/g.91468 Transcript_30221/m.91468 type:complete len:249 (+) Transcript_30221:328-1074(+)
MASLDHVNQSAWVRLELDQVGMFSSHQALAQVLVNRRIGRRVEVPANQQRHVLQLRRFQRLQHQVDLPKLDICRFGVGQYVRVHHAQLMAATRPLRLPVLRRLQGQVLQDHHEGDIACTVAFPPRQTSIAINLACPARIGRDLVVIKRMLVNPTEARRLEEGRAPLDGVLALVKDWFPPLALERALVTGLGQLRLEPFLECVFLNLLQRDDVSRHGLQFLDDQVFPPSPRERPLFAIWVLMLVRVQIR